jgi:hypothetical protein
MRKLAVGFGSFVLCIVGAGCGDTKIDIKPEKKPVVIEREVPVERREEKKEIIVKPVIIEKTVEKKS